jgi:hypothetical protein
VSRSLRDTTIVVVSLGLSVFEIVSGGARPAVLSFLGAILLSPIVMAVDAKRRERVNGNGTT